ncbi:hypothetical protein V6N12_002695 [Hibiscus sabdariffa]|uniref:FYR C-terminal domain-containing protein n=1 Tax=Hibiscus sabdariffa TaxID=183260 RepID=A0ABR2EB93_9ROSI
MLQLQNGRTEDDGDASCEDKGNIDSVEDHMKKNQGIQITLSGPGGSSYVIGDLQIISIGKVVKDSEYFQDDGIIWPEGYTVVREAISVKDPSICTLYRMEVLRDPQAKNHPLFRVECDGEKFEGPAPSACWNKIYKRIRKILNDSSDSNAAKGRFFESGADMFGFSNPEVIKLIQGLSKSRLSSKFSASKLAPGRFRDLPAGYRPVRVDWKDLDKCSVCHMDELEDEDRVFLLSVDEDDEDQCIRLLSFCKKHRQPSNDRVEASDERVGRIVRQFSDYTPPLNPSGCARTEPYSHLGRRGRKEPEALAAASLKRLFVENQPYLVGGFCQHAMSGTTMPNNRVNNIKFSFSLNKLKVPQLDAPNNILSVAEKYDYMSQTVRKRLAFGK